MLGPFPVAVAVDVEALDLEDLAGGVAVDGLGNGRGRGLGDGGLGGLGGEGNGGEGAE